ncbi:hypothetical protein HU200_011157 [Digitaria exilis]|uniref:Nucleotide-diphospho-sugar transferase domain-containing protein n=1 Tax=Digitaria exilis TaxID=1010633 RepID=A0A835KMS5_9POAL|nr:hypothetical protein HU200_011157 [Digitaria exilis]
MGLLGFASKEVSSHGVSFLLGAALPTALLIFLASDRLGDGLSTTISSSQGNGAVLPAAADPNEAIFKDLPELLRKVAMEDRTVIITSVNEAWSQPGSLLDLYLDSFKNGEDIAHLLDHLIVVALDAGGFERCKVVHPHCYYLLNATSTDISSANSYMTPAYLELVWTKLTFQQQVLELGYNFLFTAR